MKSRLIEVEGRLNIEVIEQFIAERNPDLPRETRALMVAILYAMTQLPKPIVVLTSLGVATEDPTRPIDLHHVFVTGQSSLEVPAFEIVIAFETLLASIENLPHDWRLPKLIDHFIHILKTFQ